LSTRCSARSHHRDGPWVPLRSWVSEGRTPIAALNCPKPPGPGFATVTQTGWQPRPIGVTNFNHSPCCCRNGTLSWPPLNQRHMVVACHIVRSGAPAIYGGFHERGRFCVYPKDKSTHLYLTCGAVAGGAAEADHCCGNSEERRSGQGPSAGAFRLLHHKDNFHAPHASPGLPAHDDRGWALTHTRTPWCKSSQNLDDARADGHASNRPVTSDAPPLTRGEFRAPTSNSPSPASLVSAMA